MKRIGRGGETRGRDTFVSAPGLFWLLALQVDDEGRATIEAPRFLA